MHFENIGKQLGHLMGNWPLDQKGVQMTYRGLPADKAEAVRDAKARGELPGAWAGVAADGVLLGSLLLVAGIAGAQQGRQGRVGNTVTTGKETGPSSQRVDPAFGELLLQTRQVDARRDIAAELVGLCTLLSPEQVRRLEGYTRQHLQLANLTL